MNQENRKITYDNRNYSVPDSLTYESRNYSVPDSLANSQDELIDRKYKKPLIQMRYVIIFLCFLSTIIMFMLRINISVAIVSMVNHTAIDKSGQSLNGSNDDGDSCPISHDKHDNDIAYRGEFVWDDNKQGLLLGAYFYGYAISQIIGGRIAERWGARWLTWIGIVAQIITTLLTPMAAYMGHMALFVCRVIMGTFNGVIFSSQYTLFSFWVPNNERATALGITTTGCNVGSAIGMVLTAWLCEFNIGDKPGWPLAFYVPGACCIIWALAWIIFVTNTPEENRFVSEYEIKYIQNNITKQPKKVASVPWKDVLLSKSIWGFILTKSGCVFSYIMLASKLPAYLESVLWMDMTKNGLVNFLIHVTISLSTPIGGPLSEYIAKKQIFSLTTIRKIFAALAYLGPAISLALIPSAGCNENLIIALLIISMLTIGLDTGGSIPIISEMAPAISGTIFGFINTFSSAVGFIAPLVAGHILEDNPKSRKAWNLIFYISSGLGLLGITSFILTATAEPQPWGDGSNNNNNNNNNDDDDNNKNNNNSFSEKEKEIQSPSIIIVQDNTR